MASAGEAPQGAPLVQGDMRGLVALDLVLRRVGAGVVNVALPVDVLAVHPHDAAAHPARLRVPADVIADLVFARHAQDMVRPAPRSSGWVVGWVERSETHRLNRPAKLKLLGF